jgi:hypothetical protein
LQGFGEVWSANNTVLRCFELPSSDKRTTIIVAVISAVAGLALLSALLLVVQLYMRTRPKWLREHIMETKRKQGAPRCRTRGEKVHVSIVVTDVKDYTALTREQPEAMNRAIGVHNNILRKVSNAVCLNFGQQQHGGIGLKYVAAQHTTGLLDYCLRLEVSAQDMVAMQCMPEEHLGVVHAAAAAANPAAAAVLLQACHTHAGYVLDQVNLLQQCPSPAFKT